MSVLSVLGLGFGVIDMQDSTTISYRKGYKYQLTDTLYFNTGITQVSVIDTGFIRLEPDGLLRLKAGYAWDGCSGPAIDTNTNMFAGAVHDALYQLMRMGLLEFTWRMLSDKVFRKICLRDGMWVLRAKYFYLGVDLFAASAASAVARKKILIAPLLALMLVSACTITPARVHTVVGAGAEIAQEVDRNLLRDSVYFMCKGASVQSIKEEFWTDRARSAAWYTICYLTAPPMVKSIPPNPPLVGEGST